MRLRQRQESLHFSSEEVALLMVGIALPAELMETLALQDRYPGIQGHNHQWAVIGGIEEASGCPMDLLSVAAIGDYPRHPLKFMDGGHWKHCTGAKDRWIPFINVFPLKQIGIACVVWLALMQWLWQHRRAKQKIIFIYSTQSARFLPVLFATAFFSTCKIAIMTDPPSVDLPGEGRLYKKVRQCDRWLQRFVLKRLEGMIVLAKDLALDYAPGIPYQIVEGIAPDMVEPEDTKSASTSAFIIMYAGTLKTEYGVQLLLDSLPYLSADTELWIFGSGPLAETITERATHEHRLRYFGFQPNKEMAKAARQADVLVNPRPSKSWFTRYSFPSKILEYLALGRPVISTRLPTIPADYEPYLLWLEDETPEGFAQLVQTLYAMPREERVALGKKGRDFVQQHKSKQSQGVHMWNFAVKVSSEMSYVNTK